MAQLGQYSTLLLLLIPVALLQICLVIAALLDLARRERFKLLPRWAWILIIVFVNFFGPIAYFVVGRDE